MAISANQRGILAICASMATYTINDAMVKGIAQVYPVGEVIFIRGLFTVLLLIVVVTALGHAGAIRQAASRPVINRSLCDGISSGCFVVALVHMKLADLAAILQTMPLILTGLAALIFGEVVGWRRWSAILLGFVGTLFVVKPTAEAFNIWALIAFGAAASSAFRETQTRRIAAGVPTMVVALMGAACIALVGLAFLPFETWRALALRDVAILAAAAVFVAMGTYFMTRAFRGVDLSVVAPFRYSYLITSAIAGWLVFSEWPDLWSVFGAALIVASGLYTLYREAVRRRAVTADTAAAL